MKTETEVLSGASFKTDGEALKITSDACLLSAFVSKNAKNKAVELCCGSGVISVMLLQAGKISSFVAVDKQEHLCEMARENAQNAGLAGKMEVICADIKDYKPGRLFDTAVCNPPYLKADTGDVNKTASSYISRHETSADIGDFTKAASRCLKDGGTFYCCYMPERAADLYCACRASGLEPKEQLLVYPTPSHKPFLLLLKAKKGARSGMTTNPPLFVYEGEAGGEFARKFIDFKENRG